MRVPSGIAFAVLLGCAGPGGVTAGRNADGVEFIFARGGAEGIELIGVEVFEWDNGVRGNTVCELRITQEMQARTTRLARWVYGRNSPDGDYRVGNCTELVPGREYGIAGFRYDHRLVHTRFRVTNDGSVIHEPD